MEKVKSSKTIFHSFIYAMQGWKEAYKESRNLRFHVAFGLLTLFFSFLFNLTTIEWFFIILYLGAITSAEMFNTAIEDVVNLLRDKAGVDYKYTGKAKDIAAGATFIITISAIVTGLIIFVPKILDIISFLIY